MGVWDLALNTAPAGSFWCRSSESPRCPQMASLGVKGASDYGVGNAASGIWSLYVGVCQNGCRPTLSMRGWDWALYVWGSGDMWGL